MVRWQGAAQDSLTGHGCTLARLLLRCAGGGFFDCIELIWGQKHSRKPEEGLPRRGKRFSS